MTPIEQYNQTIAAKIIKALEKRNMEGFYCATKEQALQKALEIIEPKSTVAWGGSQSINQIGLLNAVRGGDYTVLDRDATKNADERIAIQHQSFLSDYYLMSTNAISMDGILVNIDGLGNRIAALAYGPKTVLMVVGMNKVTMDEPSAMARARNIAAPQNNIRLSLENSCTTTSICHNCTNSSCICAQIAITRFSAQKNRIKIIFVGEHLGF